VKKMDLMRIRGVGVKHGALLLAAGVDTVPELAQRNPKNLHAALADVNAAKQIVVDLPKETEVADWVARAKAAPRIIMY
jgi:chlorosome envelope protein I